MTGFSYQLSATDAGSRARTGIWSTPHGSVRTPAFMPVGTLATVKGLTPDQIRSTRAEMVLANTYHLALRPGAAVVAEMGGLHRFMSWPGPILTDSGGFQVFSLAKLNRIDDERVVFRSHIDGSQLELTPEKAIDIQEQLGADCIMCFDQCPPADWPIPQIEAAVDRTTRWAQRCRDAQKRTDQALFGIVQGAIDFGQRERSATALVPLDFPGYAIGGLSVGETSQSMYETIEFTTPFLPVDKPRYLMGVGTPADLLQAILRGIDLFDCVMPTRNGRNAMAFTSRGPVKLRNLKHRTSELPLDPECPCIACRQFTLAYLRHLFVAGEMLGPTLISIHNLTFYQTVLAGMRAAILENRAGEYVSCQLAQWKRSV